MTGAGTSASGPAQPVANPWDADRVLTGEIATRAIHAAVPFLAPAEAVRLGAGWDFDAYEIQAPDGPAYVFKFPRRAGEVVRLERELEVSALVAGRLPHPTPTYAWPLLQGPGFPHAFSGYPKLPGVRLLEFEATDARCAALTPSFAGFLRALHDIDALGLTRVEPVPRDAAQSIRTRPGRFFQGQAAWAPPALAARIAAWWFDPARVPPPYEGPRCLIHDDLHAEHTLLDETGAEVVGVIDWGDVALGDPAADFLGYIAWGGPRLIEPLLDAYAPAPAARAGLRTRILFGAMISACIDAEYFHRKDLGRYLPRTLGVIDALLACQDA